MTATTTTTAPHIESVDQLKHLATELRIEIVKMIGAAGSGHPGGSLSAIDMITALYFNVMRIDPKNPSWEDRDRFILSKGHCCPALYAAMAYAGYFDKSLLPTLRKMGSPLQGHPDRRFLPSLDASTGSLGQGLSIGIGMAMAGKLDKKDYHVFVMVGDGESQEGQIWEAAMFAPYHKLNNLTLIVDNNGQQLDDFTDKILSLRPLPEKLRSFGWDVIEINGNDMAQCLDAAKKARANNSEKPTAIVANTVKGAGVSFMEHNVKWHGVAPKPAEVEAAVKELQAKL
jgi:transketolase